LQDYKNHLEILLSKERLDSYNGDINAHFTNLKLIALITPKLAMLEIALRNMCDYWLCNRIGENWLININDEIIQESLADIRVKQKKTNLNHHQYLSRLTLGNIIKIIRDNALQNAIFNLREMDFKRYDESNRNFCFINGKKTKISNYGKVDIVLSLLLTIRNRSFHWENLNKTTQKDNKTFPRLTTQKHGTHIGINPQRIQTFLNDLLNNINKDLIGRCSLELNKEIERGWA